MVPSLEIGQLADKFSHRWAALGNFTNCQLVGEDLNNASQEYLTDLMSARCGLPSCTRSHSRPGVATITAGRRASSRIWNVIGQTGCGPVLSLAETAVT